MKNVIVPIENMSLVKRVLLELKEKLIRANKHTANVDLYCELEVRDKSGKLVSYKRFRSKSFVGNFMDILRNYFIFVPQTGNNYSYQQPTGVNGSQYVDTAGNTVNPIAVTTGGNVNMYDFFANSNRAVNVTANYWLPPIALGASSGDDSYGILVGNGTTTPAPGDANLTGKLTNSQIAYGTVSIDASPSTSGNTVTLRVTRTFTNNGTSTISVSESGLVAKIVGWELVSTSLIYANILIAHDVFTAQSVASGQVLTVRYIIQITT